jgi:hypothetical protein
MTTINNNTKLLNDQTAYRLFRQLSGNNGIVSCPLGKIIYKEQLDGTIEATSQYVRHNWSLD